MELKHLAPYLPYGLKFMMVGDHREEFLYDEWEGKEEDYMHGAIWQYAGEIDKVLNIPIGDGDLSRVFRKGLTWITIDGNSLKPILRPLSDLTKEIEVDGNKFVPLRILYGEELPHEYPLKDRYLKEFEVNYAPYWFMEKLFEWHFDVFGLIEKGLAIDINTL